MTISIDDIYLKIGRNIVLFQSIERNLKIILANSQLSGPVRNLSDIKKNNVESIKKKTLGNLIQQFTSNYSVPSLNDMENSDNKPIEEDSAEFHFSYEIRMETDLPRYEDRKSRLSEILNERNDLVHHLLLKYNLSLNSHRESLANLLDVQFENATIEQQQLEFDINRLKESLIYLSKLIKSPLYENLFINPDLMNCIFLAIDKYSRSDGWTNFIHVGRIISQQMPEKYKKIKEFHKVKKLSDLIIKTAFCEIMLETDSKGVSHKYLKLKNIEDNHTKT